jgi:hypothetical protein
LIAGRRTAQNPASKWHGDPCIDLLESTEKQRFFIEHLRGCAAEVAARYSGRKNSLMLVMRDRAKEPSARDSPRQRRDLEIAQRRDCPQLPTALQKAL